MNSEGSSHKGSNHKLQKELEIGGCADLSKAIPEQYKKSISIHKAPPKTETSADPLMVLK